MYTFTKCRIFVMDCDDHNVTEVILMIQVINKKTQKT